MRWTAFLSSSSSRASALPLIGWLLGDGGQHAQRLFHGGQPGDRHGSLQGAYAAEQCAAPALTGRAGARYRIEE